MAGVSDTIFCGAAGMSTSVPSSSRRVSGKVAAGSGVGLSSGPLDSAGTVEAVASGGIETGVAVAGA